MRAKNLFLHSLGGVILAGCGSMAALAQFDIDPAVSYPVGQRPGGIAAADINGNMLLDLAVVTDGGGNQDRIEFLMNNGDGTYSAGGFFLLPSGAGAGEIVAGDFDGDGDTDFAVILKNQNSIQVVLNAGGVFSSGGFTTIGENGRGLAKGDYNGDGFPDLAVANRDSNTASVLRNNGDATFAVITLPVGDEPRGATFGDFTGNGLLDIAVTNSRDRNISIFLNDGAAFIASGTVSVGAQRRPEGIVSADLNGDGLDDLAAASNGNGFESASVFIATGGGTFSAVVHYNTGGVDTSGILTVDLDCDGMIDIATRNADSNNLSLLRNLGGGTFGAAQLVAVGTHPDQMIAADLDGDGDADLAVANRDSNNVSVLINQTCEQGPVAADLLSATVLHGTHLSGGLAELRDSDDMRYRAASAFGFTAQEPNLLRIRVEAQSGVATPATLDFTSEARLNNPGGTVRYALRNWGTNAMDTILTAPIGTTEVVHTVPGLGAGAYVRSSDGRIENELRYVVLATFSVSGFVAEIDQVMYEVE